MRRTAAIILLTVTLLNLFAASSLASGGLSVSPSNLSFGSVNAGSSFIQSFGVTNNGDGTTSLSVSVSGSCFELVSAPSSLGPGQKGQVTVRFAPTAATSYSGNVYLGSIYGSVAISLSGTGVTAPIISVTVLDSPDDREDSFGYVAVGSFKPKTYQVTNLGSATLTGSASVSGTGFSISNGGSYSIAPDGVAFVTVRFSPTTSANFTGTVTFSGGGGASRTVTGNSLAPAAISLSPSVLDFGSVNIGGTSYQSITVTNTGGGTLTGACTVTGNGYSTTGNGAYSLAAGQSTTVTIAFSPLTSTTYSGTASFSGASVAATASLTGKGKAPSASVSISPASRAFGSVNVGSSKTTTFSVTNTYDGPVTITATASSAFSIVSGGYTHLALGQSATITVRFTPVASGAVSDVVHFLSTVADGTHGSASAIVSGTGVATVPVIAVTPASHDFGDVTTGQTRDTTFTVTNVGGGTLTGTASTSGPGYTIIGSASYSLTAGQRANITVRFAPVSPTTYSGTASFTGGGGATRSLVGRGELPPTIAVSPAVINFGSIQVSQSNDQRFTVTNIGGGILTGNISISGTGFSLVGSGSYSLAAGQSAMITVRFSPTAATTYSGSASFTGGGGASAALQGAGYSSTAPAPVLSVSPTSLPFGTVYVTHTKELAFTVTNTGGGVLTGAASITHSNFAIIGGASYSLGSGQSTTILVRFGPTAATSYSGTVSFTGGGGAARSVTGTGQFGGPSQTPVISVTGNLAYGAVPVGATKDMTFTVTNTGTGTLTGNVSLSGSGYSLVGTGSYSLAGGHSAVITVRFAPTAVTTYSGSASFTGGGGASRTLSGSGVTAASPILSVSPSSLSYGTVNIGQTKDMTVTVSNVGGGTLTGGASLSHSNYTIVGSPSYSLAAGQSTTITVRFGPSAADTYTGVVQFTGGGAASVGLSGTGAFLNLPPLKLSVSSGINFGQVDLDVARTAKFTVTNAGSGLIIGSASIGGAAFRIIDGGSYTLAAGQSATVTVEFEPTEEKYYTGTASFSGGGEVITRPVMGTGYDPYAPRISVSPGAVAFGTMFVNSSLDRLITVTNVGGRTLTGTATVAPPFYIVSGGNYALGAGASQSVTVRFKPSLVKSYSDSVSFSGGGGTLLPVTGTGYAVNPILDVLPPILDFGNVPYGQSKELSFTVSNVGINDLTGSSTTYSAPAVSQFNYTGTTQTWTSPGGLVTFDVYGAKGAGSGGHGGYVKGSYMSSPGDIFYIRAGGQNGFNGGGAGGSGYNPGYNGGGLSEVRIGSPSGTILLVAGGGGGSGGNGASAYGYYGGIGGGHYYWIAQNPSGGNGQPYNGGGQGGSAGTGTMQGGQGGAAYNSGLNAGGGGGGGGGYQPPSFGGGGGGGNRYYGGSGGGGAAGSNYINHSLILNGTGVLEGNNGNGSVKITVEVPPNVITHMAVPETASSARLVGAMVNPGGPTSTAHGFVWSTSPEPTIANNVVNLGSRSTTGSFSTQLTGLTQGVTYYVRAYAVNPHWTHYGEEVAFVLGGSTLAGYTFIYGSGFAVLGSTNFSLPSGASSQLTVRFTPTTSNAYFSQAVIFSSNGGNLTRTMTGSSFGGPNLTVSPATLSFGDLSLGATRTMTFTVTNTGTSTLTGSASVASGASTFSILPSASFSLAPSASTVVTVRYAPNATGVHNGVIRFTSNGGNVDRTVSGSGSAAPGGSPAISITPDSLIFGQVPIGEPREIAFTVTNIGQGTLVGNAAMFSGDGFYILDPKTFSLAQGQSSKITVRFSPSMPGLQNGMIHFNTNAGSEFRPMYAEGVPGTRKIRLID